MKAITFDTIIKSIRIGQSGDGLTLSSTNFPESDENQIKIWVKDKCLVRVTMKVIQLDMFGNGKEQKK